MPERLANRLKDRRSELGLTQAELAEKVGVTRKTVNTVGAAIRGQSLGASRAYGANDVPIVPVTQYAVIQVR